MSKRQRYAKAHQIRQHQKGLCVCCPRKLEPGSNAWRCPLHAALCNEARRRLRAKRRLERWKLATRLLVRDLAAAGRDTGDLLACLERYGNADQRKGEVT